jgi:hypothetical protein
VAEHRVQFKTQSCEVTRGDRIVFKVTGDKAKVGEVHVSVQGVAWMPKGKKKGQKMTWEKFDQVMQAAGGWPIPRKPSTRKVKK